MSKDAWTSDRKYSAGQLLGYSGARRRSSRLRQLNSDNRLKGTLLLSALFWYYLFTWYLPSPGYSTPLKRAYSHYGAIFSKLLSGKMDFGLHEINEHSVTVVTLPHPGGYAATKLPAPFDTELLHVVTSIHPVKGINATQEYQATTLLQLKAGEPNDLSFFCNFGNVRYMAEITTLQQYPLISATTLTVECKLPPWSRSLHKEAPPEERRRVLRDMASGPYALTLEWQSRSQSSARGALPMPHWTAPIHKSTLSACTKPIQSDDSLTAADLIEWRVHHFLQGIETVHWYARNPQREKWIKSLSTHLGLRDSFHHAPDLATADSAHPSTVDEDVWYQDCLLRNSLNDDWVIRLSTTQYLQRDSGTSTVSIKALLDSLPLKIAGFEVKGEYLGQERPESAPHLDGYPDFPRTARPRHTMIKAGDKNIVSTSFHRTAGILSMNAAGGLRSAEGYMWSDSRKGSASDARSITVLEARQAIESEPEKAYVSSENDTVFWQEEEKYLKALRKLLSMPIT